MDKDMDKDELWFTPVKVKEYFSKNPEKGQLANKVLGSAMSMEKVGDLKEVLVVAGSSQYGKGAYIIAWEPPYFPSDPRMRCCRTAAYLEPRTEEEIRQFIGVYGVLPSYGLPQEIADMYLNAHVIKAHWDNNLVIKLLDSNEAVELLDDLFENEIPISKPLPEQIKESEEKSKQMLGHLAEVEKHIHVVHIKTSKE